MAETDWLGIGITIFVIFFIIILVWSRMQQQKISETIEEIRDILRGSNG